MIIGEKKLKNKLYILALALVLGEPRSSAQTTKPPATPSIVSSHNCADFEVRGLEDGTDSSGKRQDGSKIAFQSLSEDDRTLAVMDCLYHAGMGVAKGAMWFYRPDLRTGINLVGKFGPSQWNIIRDPKNWINWAKAPLKVITLDGLGYYSETAKWAKEYKDSSLAWAKKWYNDRNVRLANSRPWFQISPYAGSTSTLNSKINQIDNQLKSIETQKANLTRELSKLGTEPSDLNLKIIWRTDKARIISDLEHLENKGNSLLKTKLDLTSKKNLLINTENLTDMEVDKVRELKMINAEHDQAIKNLDQEFRQMAGKLRAKEPGRLAGKVAGKIGTAAGEVAEKLANTKILPRSGYGSSLGKAWDTAGQIRKSAWESLPTLKVNESSGGSLIGRESLATGATRGTASASLEEMMGLELGAENSMSEARNMDDLYKIYEAKKAQADQIKNSKLEWQKVRDGVNRSFAKDNLKAKEDLRKFLVDQENEESKNFKVGEAKEKVRQKFLRKGSGLDLGSIDSETYGAIKDYEKINNHVQVRQLNEEIVLQGKQADTLERQIQRLSREKLPSRRFGAPIKDEVERERKLIKFKDELKQARLNEAAARDGKSKLIRKLEVARDTALENARTRALKLSEVSGMNFENRPEYQNALSQEDRMALKASREEFSFGKSRLLGAEGVGENRGSLDLAGRNKLATQGLLDDFISHDSERTFRPADKYWANAYRESTIEAEVTKAGLEKQRVLIAAAGGTPPSDLSSLVDETKNEVRETLKAQVSRADASHAFVELDEEMATKIKAAEDRLNEATAHLEKHRLDRSALTKDFEQQKIRAEREVQNLKEVRKELRTLAPTSEEAEEAMHNAYRRVSDPYTGFGDDLAKRREMLEASAKGEHDAALFEVDQINREIANSKTMNATEIANELKKAQLKKWSQEQVVKSLDPTSDEAMRTRMPPTSVDDIEEFRNRRVSEINQYFDDAKKAIEHPESVTREAWDAKIAKQNEALNKASAEQARLKSAIMSGSSHIEEDSSSGIKKLKIKAGEESKVSSEIKELIEKHNAAAVDSAVANERVSNLTSLRDAPSPVTLINEPFKSLNDKLEIERTAALEEVNNLSKSEVKKLEDRLKNQIGEIGDDGKGEIKKIKDQIKAEDSKSSRTPTEDARLKNLNVRLKSLEKEKEIAEFKKVHAEASEIPGLGATDYSKVIRSSDDSKQFFAEEGRRLKDELAQIKNEEKAAALQLDLERLKAGGATSREIGEAQAKFELAREEIGAKGRASLDMEYPIEKELRTKAQSTGTDEAYKANVKLRKIESANRDYFDELKRNPDANEEALRIARAEKIQAALGENSSLKGQNLVKEIEGKGFSIKSAAADLKGAGVSEEEKLREEYERLEERHNGFSDKMDKQIQTKGGGGSGFTRDGDDHLNFKSKSEKDEFFNNKKLDLEARKNLAMEKYNLKMATKNPPGSPVGSDGGGTVTDRIKRIRELQKKVDAVKDNKSFQEAKLKAKQILLREQKDIVKLLAEEKATEIKIAEAGRDQAIRERKVLSELKNKYSNATSSHLPGKSATRDLSSIQKDLGDFLDTKSATDKLQQANESLDKNATKLKAANELKAKILEGPGPDIPLAQQDLDHMDFNEVKRQDILSDAEITPEKLRANLDKKIQELETERKSIEKEIGTASAKVETLKNEAFRAKEEAAYRESIRNSSATYNIDDEIAEKNRQIQEYERRLSELKGEKLAPGARDFDNDHSKAAIDEGDSILDKKLAKVENKLKNLNEPQLEESVADVEKGKGGWLDQSRTPAEAKAEHGSAPHEGGLGAEKGPVPESGEGKLAGAAEEKAGLVAKDATDAAAAYKSPMMRGMMCMMFGMFTFQLTERMNSAKMLYSDRAGLRDHIFDLLSANNVNVIQFKIPSLQTNPNLTPLSPAITQLLNDCATDRTSPKCTADQSSLTSDDLQHAQCYFSKSCNGVYGGGAFKTSSAGNTGFSTLQADLAYCLLSGSGNPPGGSATSCTELLNNKDSSGNVIDNNRSANQNTIHCAFSSSPSSDPICKDFQQSNADASTVPVPKDLNSSMEKALAFASPAEKGVVEGAGGFENLASFAHDGPEEFMKKAFNEGAGAALADYVPPGPSGQAFKKFLESVDAHKDEVGSHIPKEFAGHEKMNAADLQKFASMNSDVAAAKAPSSPQRAKREIQSAVEKSIVLPPPTVETGPDIWHKNTDMNLFQIISQAIVRSTPKVVGF